MKAIGLQSRDVLGLLLLENRLIGLLGGAIGAIGVLLMCVLSESPSGFPFLTLAALVLLAVVIALVATLVTADGTAREKPLVVLRHE